MSGGCLVVTDRAGRDIKRYSLPSGLVTVGSDAACDIRVMLPAVSAHHATVHVRNNQAIIRNVSDGETLVNGRPISVFALGHGDTITLGDRSLRWEYNQPAAVKPANSQPALYSKKGAKKGRGRKRASEVSVRRLDPAVHLLLEMNHSRASMPGGGKQVAIVQPQRRDTGEIHDTNPRLVIQPHRPYAAANKRGRRSSNTKPHDTSITEEKKRKSTPKTPIKSPAKTPAKPSPAKPSPAKPSPAKPSPGKSSPNNIDLQNTTKATLWIESRKSSPRISTPVVPSPSPKRAVKKATPLRTVVLRKTMTPVVKNVPVYTPRKVQSVSKVAKIQAPLKIDHTKQAALMLMARHTPKGQTPNPKQTPVRGPSLVVKKNSPKSAKKSPKSAKKSPKSAKKSPRSAKKSPPKPISTPVSVRMSARNATLTPSVFATPKPPTKTPAKAIATPKGAKTPASARISRSATVTPQSVHSVGNVSPRKTSPRKGNDSVISVLSPQSAAKSPRKSTRGAGDDESIYILEVTGSIHKSRRSNSHRSSITSPSLLSPKKSALKDPTAKKSTRKNESIKFDLSNLENYQDEPDILILSDTTKGRSFRSDKSSDDEVTLRYSESPKVPSPRRSLHSRSSVILQKTLGDSVFSDNTGYETSTLTPESPKARRSIRSSIIVEKALNTPEKSGRYSSRTTKSVSNDTLTNQTRSSPKSPKRQMESYSIVDLVSIGSNDSSVYDSAGSMTTAFETPQSKVGRKTRSTINPVLVGSSTPYIGKTPNRGRPSKRSIKSNSDTFLTEKSVSPKRSKSFTPETRDSTINTTRKSRVSRRTQDSDLIVLSRQSASESPKTSRKNTRVSETLQSPSLRLSRSAENSPRGKQSPSPKTRPSLRKTGPSISPSILQSSPKTRQSRITASPQNLRNSRSKISLNISSAKNTTISPKNTSKNTKRTSKTSLKGKASVGSPKNKTPVSPKTRKGSRSSRSNATLNVSGSPQSDGLHTPENTTVPSEAGTPVLSIQSLLDSSNASLLQAKNKSGRISKNLKRKTIGARASVSAKSGRKSSRSTSLNLSAAKRILTKFSKDSSSASDKTDEGAPKPSKKDTVTPKSTVKLIQEAVKGKHSTAKKPVSKRSIIDNLNDSDIVKQLFSSPVKRKLSQSMTEYTRTQLFDDEVASPKRKTRRTIALGKTPDHSLLDNTGPYPTEVFVSPLNTPTSSPNLSGIKRLVGPKSPRNSKANEVQNTRSRKSVKNDLTNIAGVKEVFAKSPRNRLSDLRGVKEIFIAGSPNNDLRRVSGVKSLFQTIKKTKQPKNSLTNVGGLKTLFKRKSPKNDLGNVSGVKRILSKSPKNDLRDVRGVKRIFTREKSGAGLSDVSGVEELFNVSFDSNKAEASGAENLFDQLVGGKPVARATYAKSFNKSRHSASSNKRAAKSLNTSITKITNNVEEWIENELQNRLSKHDSIISHTSTSKSKSIRNSKTPKNVTKALQKLVTDTLEGNTPLQRSRVRNNTLVNNVSEQPKRYSEHTLPLKKRSFSEKSLEKSINESKSNILPIKKRALIHSTPVKGKFNLTANVSELGRVSPIVPDNINEADISITKPAPKSPRSKPVSPARKTLTPKAKTPRQSATRNSEIASPKRKSIATPKASPKTRVSITRKSVTKAGASPKVISTKRKTATPKAKPSPKPKRIARGLAEQEIVAVLQSPLPKRGTRASKAKVSQSFKPASPKGKASLKAKASPKAKAKPSPKAKASPKSKAKPSPIAKPSPKPTPSPAKPTRGKKAVETTPVTNTKRKQASLVITKKPPVLTPQPKRGRGKAIVEVTPITPVTSPVKGKATRGRKQEKAPTPKPRTRVKQSSLVISKPSPQMKPKAAKQIVVTDTKTRRGRKTAEKPIEIVASPPKRGRKKVESPIKISEKPKRGRKETIIAKPPTPKNKSITPKKARRGRTEVKPPTPKRSKSLKKSEEPETKRARGRNTDTKVTEGKTSTSITRKSPTGPKKEEPVKTRRGQKTDSFVIEAPKGRKRKIEEVGSPVKSSKRGKTETKVEPKAVRGRQKISTAQEKAVTPKKVAAKVTKKSASSAKKPARGRKTQESEVKPGAKGRKRKSAEITPAAKEAVQKEVTSKRGRGSTAAKKAATPVKTGRSTRRKAEPAVEKPAARRKLR